MKLEFWASNSKAVIFLCSSFIIPCLLFLPSHLPLFYPLFLFVSLLMSLSLCPSLLVLISSPMRVLAWVGVGVGERAVVCVCEGMWCACESACLHYG